MPAPSAPPPQQPAPAPDASLALLGVAPALLDQPFATPGVPAALLGAVHPLQVTPAPATPLAFVGTFLLGWAFFAFTAQIAASFFLPGPPWRRAVVVGLVPAAASMALIRFDTLVILLVGLVADAAAIHLVYGVRYRTTAMMTALHYTATVAIVLLIANLLALLSTAPG